MVSVRVDRLYFLIHVRTILLQIDLSIYIYAYASLAHPIANQCDQLCFACRVIYKYVHLVLI